MTPKQEEALLNLIRSMAVSLKGIKETLEVISENMTEDLDLEEDLDEEDVEEEVEESGTTGKES